jgi:Transglutaminase-like superfamily
VSASLASSVTRLLRRKPRELATIVHVLAVLAFVEASIRWVPLPRLSRVLGAPVTLAPTRGDAAQYDLALLPLPARRRLWITGKVADVWPLSRGPCLRRALVGGHLIREWHPAVRLGVGGVGDTLHAHAWIEIDDRPLERIEGFSRFQLSGPTAP